MKRPTSILMILVGTSLCLSSIGARAETIWYPLPPEAYSLGKMYPDAQKLLFGFDYGHAITYERLLLSKGNIQNADAFEKMLLGDIFGILAHPPSVKVDEQDIAPAYTYAFPLMINLFDWSHFLHQFVYDVLASSEDRGPAMIARIEEIFAKYKTNRPIAITDQCKTMLFMDGHPFSKEFRRTYPSLNLLIWSYHWLQIRLTEALLKPTRPERDQEIAKTLRGFRELVANLPDSAEFDMMPETAKVAPTFSRLFPGIAAAFDNVHMLHDIVSDLMVSEKVKVGELRLEGIRLGKMALDPNAFKGNRCLEVK